MIALSVLTAIASAEGRARHSSLETLTVVLLAARLPTIAPLEVMLALLCIGGSHELVLLIGAESSIGSAAVAVGDEGDGLG